MYAQPYPRVNSPEVLTKPSRRCTSPPRYDATAGVAKSGAWKVSVSRKARIDIPERDSLSENVGPLFLVIQFVE